MALIGKRVVFDYNNDSHHLGMTKLEMKKATFSTIKVRKSNVLPIEAG